MLFGKKKKQVKQIIEEDDEKFVIYQMFYPKNYENDIKSVPPASPIYGTKVPDNMGYYDNAGDGNIDFDYDYVRKDENKHLTEKDIIEKKGSKYYEFQIMDADKLREEFGEDAPKYEEKEPNRKVEKVVKKKDTFVETLDDFMDDKKEEEKPQDFNDPDTEFDFDMPVEEDDNFAFNDLDNDLPNPEQENIPSFLFKDDKNEEEPVVEETQEEEEIEEKDEEKDDEISFDDNSSISFDNIPSMEVPEFNFQERNNAPIDRNITMEEAIRRAKANEFPELMSGKPGSNRPENERIKNDEPIDLEAFENSIKKVEKKEEPKPEPIKTFEPIKEEPKPEPTIQAKPKPEKKEEPKKSVTISGNDYKNYSVPWDEIFPKSLTGNDSHPAWLEAKKESINATLKSFGIAGEVIDYTKGPAFTLYEIMLEAGVNVKKVESIRDNFMMALQVKSLRILAPIPGKNTIGLEAPNDVADVVKFGDLLTDSFINDGKPLNCALGKYIDNTPVYQDIAKMPHALIAGATQSGKSVSINTILVSLLAKNSPEKLKLIIVDPKMVEFTFYENIPHLACPIITDSAVATQALKWSVDEMERRYLDLARYRVKNIGDYNKKREIDPSMPALPFIVIVVDEFNDLIMTSGAEVQDYIVRLAQKARAAGIHIILATQRPTTNVVNGTIKANIPCRIAFRVASATDSMTIIDQGGAEDLLGRGDMLIVNNNAPVRAQGAYLDDEEIEGICNYLTAKYVPDYMFSLDDLKKLGQQSGGFGLNNNSDNSESEDVLYNVARFCVDSEACSINALQTRFNLGFNRASRIVSILEERGVVSKKNGTKARDILVDKHELNEMFGMEEEEDDFGED